jgi:hypothetical protein
MPLLALLTDHPKRILWLEHRLRTPRNIQTLKKIRLSTYLGGSLRRIVEPKVRARAMFGRL